jgi:hypothetical protein
MYPILAVRRAWPARLIGAVVFALGAAALAQSASDPGGALPRPAPARSGSAFNFEPSLMTRSNESPIGLTPMTTPEGITILVSAGPWTSQAIYEKLKENGLDATTGAGLIVRVQNVYPPTRITSGIERDHASRRSVRRWTLWLYTWPGSDFSLMPDRVIAHEIGLLWVAHHFEGTARAFWGDYLRIRGLAGDERIDSTAVWKREEILADDYRLLFGSAAAVEQYPRHVNRAIVDPRSVPGLRNFLIELATGTP